MLYQAQMRNFIRLVLIALLGSSLASCSTWVSDDFADPQVQLLRVEVVKAKLLEQSFILHMRIENPNDFSLPVRGLAYRVELNDVPFASGQNNTWFTVPAGGRHDFQVPIQTNLWRHVRRIVRWLEKPDEAVRYQFTGQVKTGFLFTRSVQLRRNGEIIPGTLIND